MTFGMSLSSLCNRCTANVQCRWRSSLLKLNGLLTFQHWMHQLSTDKLISTENSYKMVCVIKFSSLVYNTQHCKCHIIRTAIVLSSLYNRRQPWLTYKFAGQSKRKLDLYSSLFASSPLKCSCLDHTLLHMLSYRKRSPDGTITRYSSHLIAAYYSGRFTHINGYPSAADQGKFADQRPTFYPHRQHNNNQYATTRVHFVNIVNICTQTATRSRGWEVIESPVMPTIHTIAKQWSRDKPPSWQSPLFELQNYIHHFVI